MVGYIYIYIYVCEEEEEGAKGRESTDWVAATEAKSETKYFVQVDWVGVEDANVHLPFLEVVC